jgi:S-adenosylmethionine:tRNA ribosyltransferase-isomerase
MPSERRMNAASTPNQRPPGAKLLVIDAQGRFEHTARARLADHLLRGDLLIANDAATLPASLAGLHLRSGEPIEVRLAGRRSLAVDDVHAFDAIVFGAGDHHTRTEDRKLPPPLRAGDALQLGPLRATVLRLLDHPRLITLRFDAATPDAIRAGIARHGKPIQYAHLPQPLALWDVWTAVAALPVAFEPPSAGFVLDWQLLATLRRRGVGFATLTHAAGISSTGDAALDARLPFDEPYTLPASTAAAIEASRARGGRVVALGTTVARALEHAASLHLPLRTGPGLATQRLGAHSRLRIVDVLISGTHEPGSSHHELLRAFVDDAVLARADAALAQRGYRTHEFGDSVWVERAGAWRKRTPTLPATPTATIGSSRTDQQRPLASNAHRTTESLAAPHPSIGWGAYQKRSRTDQGRASSCAHSGCQSSRCRPQGRCR